MDNKASPQPRSPKRYSVSGGVTASEPRAPSRRRMTDAEQLPQPAAGAVPFDPFLATFPAPKSRAKRSSHADQLLRGVLNKYAHTPKPSSSGHSSTRSSRHGTLPALSEDGSDRDGALDQDLRGPRRGPGPVAEGWEGSDSDSEGSGDSPEAQVRQNLLADVARGPDAGSSSRGSLGGQRKLPSGMEARQGTVGPARGRRSEPPRSRPDAVAAGSAQRSAGREPSEASAAVRTPKGSRSRHPKGTDAAQARPGQSRGRVSSSSSSDEGPPRPRSRGKSAEDPSRVAGGGVKPSSGSGAAVLKPQTKQHAGSSDSSETDLVFEEAVKGRQVGGRRVEDAKDRASISLGARALEGRARSESERRVGGGRESSEGDEIGRSKTAQAGRRKAEPIQRVKPSSDAASSTVAGNTFQIMCHTILEVHRWASSREIVVYLARACGCALALRISL